MAISTYAELKTAVGDWLARSDLTSYTGDFVTLAEDYLNKKVRHRKMVATTDLTPASGVCTLPTDYLEHIRVVEKASIRRELSYIAPQYADQRYPDRTAGLAQNFTLVGNNLRMFPVSSNDIELTYYQKIPALSDANTTNWLLSESPHLYLRACQVMALEFAGETDTSRFQVASEMSRSMLDSLNEQNEMALYSRAPMHIAGVTP